MLEPWEVADKRWIVGRCRLAEELFEDALFGPEEELASEAEPYVEMQMEREG